jgi:RecA/RadA recombinase
MSRASNISRDRAVTEPTAIAQRLVPDVRGSLNVGRYQVLVGAAAGVLLQPIVQTTNLVAKPSTTLQIPPAPRQFLGQEAALAQAIAALQAGRSLEIVGPPGSGKSAFLRQLAHHPAVTTSHPDGILQISQLDPIGDLVQSLGETFYHLYPESYLSLSEWQAALRDCQALLMVNAPSARLEDLQQLGAILPQSTLVVTATVPRLAAAGLPQSIVTIGLTAVPLSESQQLVEAVLARSLTAVECGQLKQLWQCFRGESARMRQLAQLQRDTPTAWDHWSNWLAAHPQADEPVVQQHLVEQLMQGLDTPQRWILGLLTALAGVSLTIEQIAAMTGPQDPRSSLQQLIRLGLVQMLAQRYRAVDYLQPWLARQFVSQPWMERGATVMQDWCKGQSPEAIVAELPVVMAFTRWAAGAKHSQMVLDLARSLDPALILGKQWEQWGRVLQWALQAAGQLADTRSAAWAWHQLGTRALLLEDITTAYDALQQALKLRQASGTSAADQTAIDLTQFNLTQVIQSALPTHKQAEVRAEATRSTPYGALLVIALVTFVVALLLGLAIKPLLEPSERSDTITLGAAALRAG